MIVTQGDTTKQPWESVIYEIDCSERLPSAVTISTIAAKVFDSDGDDQSSTMIEGTPSYTGSKAYVQVKAGADGEDYNVRIRLTLSNGEDVEDDFTLYVREKA